MKNDDASGAKSSANFYVWYVVIVLLGAQVLNFVDRKLPFILIESIKQDLSLTDTQMGLLGGVLFTGVNGVAGLFLARLADRFSRKMVITWSIVGWSLMTAAGGLARNFGDFALARMGVAIGESGSAPASHSIISDYFPAYRRALAMAVFSVGGSVGFMGGLMLGGFINDVANWRTALFVVIVPGLVIAALMAFTVREPVRGASDGLASSRQSASSLWIALKTLWRKPSLRFLIIGATCFIMADTGLTAFAAAFFIRTHELSTTQTGLLFGLALGVGGGVGALLGGYVSDRAGRRDVRFRIWAPTAIKLGAVPTFTAAFLVSEPAVAAGLMCFGFVMGACFVAPTIAAIHALVAPNLRATSSAVYVLATQGVGGALGPLAVGMISDGLAPSAGPDALRYAIVIGLGTIPVGAFLYYLAGRGMPEDIAAHARANVKGGPSEDDPPPVLTRTRDA